LLRFCAFAANKTDTIIEIIKMVRFIVLLF
jgi:hypothetical protein